MKKNIGRTLFWFTDEDKVLGHLNNHFFGLGTLLNNLLNEKYKGKKIQFANIKFLSEETYEMFPIISKNYVNYYGGHLNYYGVIDLNDFSKLTENEQNYFIWEKGCKYLQDAAHKIKNAQLLEASEYAYRRGLEIDLNPDYRMLELDTILYGELIKASVWVNFKGDYMYSKFTLEKNGNIVFTRDIDYARTGIEFFLDMYKKIEQTGNTIIIKGAKGVDHLPMEIYIDESYIR